MTGDLWSSTPRTTDMHSAAVPPPLLPIAPLPTPEGDLIPWDHKWDRLKNEMIQGRRRDTRFIMFGALIGLAFGIIIAIVLKATLPALFGPPWILLGVVLVGVVAGVLGGMIPGLRPNSDGFK